MRYGMRLTTRALCFACAGRLVRQSDRMNMKLEDAARRGRVCEVCGKKRHVGVYLAPAGQRRIVVLRKPGRNWAALAEERTV